MLAVILAEGGLRRDPGGVPRPQRLLGDRDGLLQQRPGGLVAAVPLELQPAAEQDEGVVRVPLAEAVADHQLAVVGRLALEVEELPVRAAGQGALGPGPQVAVLLAGGERLDGPAVIVGRLVPMAEHQGGLPEGGEGPIVAAALGVGQ